MDPNGTNITPVETLSQNFTAYAQSSADDKIAFAYSSNVSSPAYQILTNTVLSANGATEIDAGPYVYVQSIQFTPDGTRLVYVAQTLTGTSGVYVANSDGTGTPVRLDEADDVSLSPSGDYIVYSRFFSNGEICVRKLDGSAFVRLTSNSSEDIFPQWSKDGSKIVFSSNRTGSNFNIFLMNSNGTSPVQLTSTSSNEYGSTMNTDGSVVAYTKIGANPGIYSTPAGGGSETPVFTGTTDAWIYWTTSNGRRGGIGGLGLSIGRPSLRERQLLVGR